MTARRREDLFARRNATLAHEFELTHPDGAPVDLTDAELWLEVRLFGAAPGQALIRLETVDSAERQGLFATPGSIRMRVNEVNLLVLPRASAPAAPARFAFDLVIRRPGEEAAVWRWGTLHLAPGVTRRLRLRRTHGGALRRTHGGAIRTTENG